MSFRSGAVLALIAAAAVAAGTSLAAPAAEPDPARMALQGGDVPFAKAKGKRLAPDTGYSSSYEREFELNRAYGAARILYISSEVALARTVKTTKADMAGLGKFLRSKVGREVLAESTRQELGPKATKKDVILGTLRTPPIGDQALMIPMITRSNGLRLHSVISWFRVDRTLASIVAVGTRPIGTGELGRLAAMVVAHIGEQFTPVATAPPTISGTAQQGQTLTAAPATFSLAAPITHVWHRCDAAGATCVEIAGATAPTYVVTPEDVGATLRVTVTAKNRFGAGNSQSVQTPVVT
jgi:hypothetical protein